MNLCQRYRASSIPTEINGGVTISKTLLFQYINIAKAMAEQMRPWMIR
jgi:hypothetical protein